MAELCFSFVFWGVFLYIFIFTKNTACIKQHNVCFSGVVGLQNFAQTREVANHLHPLYGMLL